ncbi:MAG TPA: ribose 5-phosphate isomerase B, partial [Armatimonadetes bacterium]|nr:ribose 5-phosphate isomerase B [Armatimonadota bacterium]
MRIAFGSDHAGYSLKESLLSQFEDLEVEDFGTYSEASCDYPDVAHKVSSAVVAGECDLGVLVCGTGVGMAIAANKIRGARAVACSDTYTARLSRDHNNANILCLGGRVIDEKQAVEFADLFLKT